MPDVYVASVSNIPLDKLWDMGKRLLLFDLDNTLVPWNHPDVPDDLRAWMQSAKRRGFQVCIVSNNHGPRVQAFSEKTNLAFVAAARKPKPAGFLQAMERFGFTPKETVMVGDQLFTDIQGGKRAGLYTVLVLPIHKDEWWGTKLNRQAERIVMRLLMQKGLKRPERSQ